MKRNLFLAAVVSLAVASILALNARAVENEVTIKGEKKVERKHKPAKNEVFHIAPDAKIRAGDNKNATVSDFKPGTVVHIAYTEENGVRTAHRVSDVLPNSADKGVITVEKARKGEKHLHAVLESVDKAANTLTVTTTRGR